MNNIFKSNQWHNLTDKLNKAGVWPDSAIRKRDITTNVDFLDDDPKQVTTFLQDLWIITAQLIAMWTQKRQGSSGEYHFKTEIGLPL